MDIKIPFNEDLRPDTGLYNAKLGIWLFLASEVMLFGALFKSVIIVDPVVVIPLTDSKKASVKCRDELEYIKGKEPNKAIKNHDTIVNKNACRRLIFIFSFLKPTYKTKPIKNVKQLI